MGKNMTNGKNRQMINSYKHRLVNKNGIVKKKRKKTCGRKQEYEVTLGWDMTQCNQYPETTIIELVDFSSYFPNKEWMYE